MACSASCAVAVAAMDRPIALFVHALLREPGSYSGDFINALGRMADLHIALALALLAGFGIAKLRSRWRGTGWHSTGTSDAAYIVFLTALAVVLSNAVKWVLKFSFGRTWPETWLQGNPSFIRDGVYGFFPFHGGSAYGSFPSGHTAAVCAAMTVLWWLLPRWRAVYAGAAGTAGIGLLGMDYHFLSDILAGAYVGWVTGELVISFGHPA